MNAVNWFEIPATDFDRAVKFYEATLGISMHREVFAGDPNGFFQYTEGQGVGGAVVKSESAAPSEQGAIIYLNAETPEKMADVLTRVPAAGGEVMMGITDIGPIGVIAFIRDSEGNRVGLHAPHAQ